MCFITGFFLIISNTVIAAVIPKVSPPNVKENISSNTFIILLCPKITDIGTPFPNAFPKQAKSGDTPNLP